MPSDDARVAVAAREFVKALEELDKNGGDAGLIADKRRRDLEAIVKAEGDS